MDRNAHRTLLCGYIHRISKNMNSRHIPDDIYRLCLCFYFDEDRVVSNVLQPPKYPILHNILFTDNNSIDLDALKEHLNIEGRLEANDAIHIINKAKDILSKEPNVLILQSPFAIHGDLHGHFWNLLRSIEAAEPMKHNLFLGNYVNRGSFGMETLLYLCANKIMHPDSYYMLRGAHDCRLMTKFFNFHDEVIYKYESEELYDAIMELFDRLPIAAIVNSKIFCVSGGLSPDVSTIADINDIDRFQEIPREGPFCDLLWSDPCAEDIGNECDDDLGESTTWFAYNESRQCSYTYGVDAITCFLKKNNLMMILRSHQKVENVGYKYNYLQQGGSVPSVITIRSHIPDIDLMRNAKGAMMQVKDAEALHIRQFVPMHSPYYLPNFMDVFSWSLPFVVDRVVDLIHEVFKYSNKLKKDEEDESKHLCT